MLRVLNIARALSLSLSYKLAHMHTHACPPSLLQFFPPPPSIHLSLPFFTLSLHESLTITAFVFGVVKDKGLLPTFLSRNNMWLYMQRRMCKKDLVIMKGTLFTAVSVSWASIPPTSPRRELWLHRLKGHHSVLANCQEWLRR